MRLNNLIWIWFNTSVSHCQIKSQGSIQPILEDTSFSASIRILVLLCGLKFYSTVVNLVFFQVIGIYLNFRAINFTSLFNNQILKQV